MRALIQRVSQARVEVEGETVAAIGPGFLVLLGIKRGDTAAQAAQLAKKVAALRIMEDAEGRLNLSLRDCGGEALVVSQFTLYADASHGRRPSFTEAAPGPEAEPLYQAFVDYLRGEGVPVETGRFGARMKVALVNDGPVTLLLES